MSSAAPPKTAKLSQELIDFARRQLAKSSLYDPNKRREERFLMMLPVVAVELDAAGEPSSEIFEMVSRDVASASVGLFHHDPLNSKRFAMRISLAGIITDLEAEVIWQASMGPFHGSAARYIKRLPNFPLDLSEWIQE